MDEKFLRIVAKASPKTMIASLLIAILGMAVSNSALANNPSCKKDSFDDQYLFSRHYRDCPDGQRTIKGTYIAEAIKKGKSIDISGAIIEGNIELIKKEKNKKTGLSALCDVKGEIKIMDSTVRGALRIHSLSRKDRIVFNQAVYLEHVIFEPEGYHRSISVESAEFAKGINLNFSTFKSDVVFDKVVFKGPVNMFGGRFRSEKDEAKQYQSDARLVRCQFKSSANFASTIFTATSFKGTGFDTDIILRRVEFEEMSFESEPFRTGTVKGDIILTDAEGDKLKISNLTIGKNLDLSDGMFPADGSIYLKETVINERFRLDGAEIPKNVEIHNSTIGQGLELRNIKVKNNEIIRLNGSRFSNIRIDFRTLLVPPKLTWWMFPWIQPGSLRLSGLKDPVGFFRNIEIDLRNEGNLADANRAMYIRYRIESEKTDRSILSRFALWIFDLSLGLGIRPGRIIFSGLILIIGFGLIFFSRVQEKTIDPKWGLWLTKLPIRYACQGGSATSALRRFWWAMCLGTVLFIKANFGGNYRVKNGRTIWIAKMEWIFGAIWIIVLVYSLSGRHDIVEIIVDAMLLL